MVMNANIRKNVPTTLHFTIVPIHMERILVDIHFFTFSIIPFRACCIQEFLLHINLTVDIDIMVTPFVTHFLVDAYRGK